VWRHRDADSRAILRGLRAGVRGEVHFCAGSIPVLRA
jgi:ribosome modulation factor